MSISPAPTNPTEQLQWLVDRAAIGDLMIEFARALDMRDWQAYAATYAPEGELKIPPFLTHTGRDGLADVVESSLSAYAGGTHHLNTNHAITITGDTATARAYLLAAHVFDNLATHADGAGWYDYELRRMDEGWRFTKVELTVRYVSGEDIKH